MAQPRRRCRGEDRGAPTILGDQPSVAANRTCQFGASARWSRNVPAAISPIASSFFQLNGSLKKTNPTSNTSSVEVPPITNDEVTLSPLAYASKVNKLTVAVATPTTTSDTALFPEKLSGAPVALTVRASATLMRKAMPVTMAVPSAGGVPEDPSRAATMYVAIETPAPTAYQNARLDTLASPSFPISRASLSPPTQCRSAKARAILPQTHQYATVGAAESWRGGRGTDERRTPVLPWGDMAIDEPTTRQYVERVWDASVIRTLTEYIRIPAKSPMFDAQWKEHGHIDRAVSLLQEWSEKRPIEGLRLDVVRLDGRTPVILMDVPGASDETVLLYGHCDKQPEMVGWADGLGPWTPVRKGDRLFGRGVGDDGYATFSALSAIEALQAARVAHARCVVLIEACEESGSYDLPFYIDALAARIGTPSLVVCLDSGCGTYDRLWGTTSLRGIVNGELTVQVLGEGVHSGAASGIVPSSFRIARQLLSRLEDELTGEIRPRDFHVTIPPARIEQARAVAKELGREMVAKYPFVSGMRAVHDDPVELLLNNTWRPALAITGAAGLPLPADGGNVLRPQTTLKLSLRLPPTCDAERAARRLKELF